MSAPFSSVAVAGTNATATEYNNARKDALTRYFKFEVVGTLVTGDGQGGSFILPFNGDVVKIYSKTTSGTATIRIKSGSTTVDSSVAVTSTYAVDSTISSSGVVLGEKLVMDITGVSSGVDLTVIVEVLAKT